MNCKNCGHELILLLDFEGKEVIEHFFGGSFCCEPHKKQGFCGCTNPEPKESVVVSNDKK